MKHTLAALVENHPGVLNRVASLFRRRGFNIESLAVGTTEQEGISRMTFVVEGDDNVGEQVEKQLYKLIDIIKVSDLSREESIVREIALIKVRCEKNNRRDILDLVEIFRAQAVDITEYSVVIQLVAHPETVDSLLENLATYPIIEMVRTGRIAMLRGPQAISVPTTEPVEVARFHQASGRRPEGELPYVSE
ncbi:MAG: acetolactate synthase small subunit [Chloroflexi bacterium]|nr:acetolactate synthase small subunit [Chloroflexota bacterium]|tara:strand:- start:41 stop:616 length:576 start_codon:yes stop_codon:yes gene_type:complete